jgi:quinoprotein glucose dehydrogenase
MSACLGLLILAMLRGAAPPGIALIQASGQVRSAEAVPADEPHVRAACGVCHTLPPPDILPRSAWRDEFVRMYFLRENRLPPLGPGAMSRVALPPDLEAVLPYYLSRAPERLPAPEAWPDPSESPIQFVRQGMTMPDMPATPAVSHVRLVDLDGDKRLDVLGTDMRQGLVFTGHPDKAGSALSVVASIPHPSHVTVTDVDKDGVLDLLVADLGTFFPEDHNKGAAIWLRGLGRGKYSAFWLDGWPRIASIDAADFNGDGKVDLAVAAFGWRKTGSVAILENQSASATNPSFTTHTIDKRTGSIDIIPVDLNHDGRMDFITLLAQEHETVVAYLNTGGFTFEQKVIYTAPHPNWGSSGIQAADLDGDGDLDVVLTHGDTFDDGLVKPYHGIQWLENTGGYPFVEHTLAQMPGVLPSRIADLDGDGDLDIAACALLAGGSDVDEKALPALIWLEQTRRGTFVRHTIEMGMPRHATLDIGDVNGDGMPDIIVGNFSINQPIASWVDVWISQGKKKTPAPAGPAPASPAPASPAPASPAPASPAPADSAPAAAVPPAADPRDWPVYGGNAAGTRYSTLAQITRDNVSQLQVAWQFDPADVPAGSSGGLQTSPIAVAGEVYTVTPGGNLVALDGATGKVRWTFASNSRGQRCRGVTYWTDGNEKRILAGFGRYVYAIDAKTGQQIQPFGRGGRIDLHQDLGRDPDSGTVDLTSPGVIYRDRYIVGGRNSESLPALPGDVRAYDVRTGQLVWSFHTIPHPGEVGYETWPKDAWTYIGGANNWAGMTVDIARGIVFVPTGSPASDFYGGNRLGDGLFGNSLIALDALTGKRIWHFQAVRHDIWDRDFDQPPVLMTVTHNGRAIDAVAQATKHGYLFVFNRETGEPLFPIEERKVPASTVPGEVTAPTQPFPLKPAPYARTLLTEDMLSHRTPAIHQWALEQFKTFRSGGQFVPFSVGQETVVMPGFDGGAEWGGSAFDPETGNIFINANDLAWTSGMRESVPGRTVARRTYVNQCSACHGLDMAGAPGFPSLVDIRSRRTAQQVSDIIRNGSARMPPAALSQSVHDALVQYVLGGDARDAPATDPSLTEVPFNFTGYHKWYDPDGYPAVAPPWGTLNAINLNTGDYTWKIPLGEYPELAASGVKDTGTENYGGPIVTAGGLLFIGATNYDNKFRAFDKDTGTLLWQTTMINAGNATPLTYEANGRQYVLIAAFGGKAGNRGTPAARAAGAFVAFALPKAVK